MRSVMTKIPVHGANSAPTWPGHGSSEQPHVALKANDHEQLVAMLVRVLPRSFFQRQIGSRASREMVACTDKAHTGDVWSVWRNPA
jgi:hypothetical protein